MTQFNGRLKFAVISKIDFSWLKIVHILEIYFKNIFICSKDLDSKTQQLGSVLSMSTENIDSRAKCLQGVFDQVLPSKTGCVHTSNADYVNRNEWPKECNALFFSTVSTKKKEEKKKIKMKYRSAFFETRRSKDSRMLIT